jgi:nucleotide-binding universal stress UspA family protein
MFTRIVVPLDGSTAAEQAIPYARELAEATDASVGLIHTTERFAEHHIADGRAARAIIEQLHPGGTDLVVMAACPHSVLHDAIAPNAANLVVASGRAPVLLVDPRATHCPGSRLVGKRIVVPVDGTEFSASAIPLAADLALGLDGTLLVLDVLPLPLPPMTSGTSFNEGVEWWPAWQTDIELKAAEAAVASVRRELHTTCPRLQVSTDVEFGNVAEHIQRLASCGDARPVGMVAMATHARTGLSRLLLGSPADDVFRQDHLPLLLINPKETA